MRDSSRSILAAIIFLLISFGGSVAVAGTFHVVIVADNGTGDDAFDRYINRDVVNVLVLASNAASEAGLSFSATALFPSELTTPNAFRISTRNGKTIRKAQHWALRNLKTPFDDIQFTRKTSIQRAEVRRTLKALKVGADDVVWFHYSGHGFRWNDKKTKWPALYIGHELEDAIEFEEALKYVKAMPARLKIAIADSCNSVVDQEMPESQKHSGARGAAARAKGFKALFGKGEGFLFMAGASPGEYGWTVDPQGSVFTYKLAHRIMIEVEKGTPASWTKLATKFKKPIRDFGIKQTPIADFRFGKGASTFRTLRQPTARVLRSPTKLSPQARKQLIRQKKVRALKVKALPKTKSARKKALRSKRKTVIRNKRFSAKMRSCLRRCGNKFRKQKKRLQACRRSCRSRTQRLRK